ncbi:MAG: hypothetical protein HQK51_13060 [Oligoflexia bacterium]|nr:hypothetical protein [Oligoflexia bacterium]
MENKGDPASLTVLAICVIICKKNQLSELIENFPENSEIKKALLGLNHLTRPFNGDLTETDKEKKNWNLDELLSDRSYFFVYTLAANRSGVTLATIIALFGITAEEVVKDLLEREVLLLREGRLYSSRIKVRLSADTILKHIPELLRFCKYGSKYTESKITVNFTESVNAESYKKIAIIMAEAYERVRKIADDESSNGEIPLFLTCILDTIEAHPIDNN